MTFPRDFSKLTTNLHQITLKILLTNLHQIIDINREERGKRRGKERGAYVGEVCLRRWRLPHARRRRVPHAWATRAARSPFLSWAPPPPPPPPLLVASAVRPWARSPAVRPWARKAAPTGCFGPDPACQPPPVVPSSLERPLLVSSTAVSRHLVGRPRKTERLLLCSMPPAATWSEGPTCHERALVLYSI